MRTIRKTTKINKGVSLTEIIVSVAIFATVAVALGNFSSDIFTLNSNAEENLSAQSDGRRILKTIVAELRSTSPSSLGAYALSQVATSSLIFFSNIDADPLKERIRYFLQDKNLHKGVIKPSGDPLVYNPADEEIIFLVRDIVNGAVPIFEYFDQTYTGTSTPLIQPVQATSVRLIKITLIIDQDPSRGTGPITVTSQVTLRNLKDNL